MPGTGDARTREKMKGISEEEESEVPTSETRNEEEKERSHDRSTGREDVTGDRGDTMMKGVGAR